MPLGRRLPRIRRMGIVFGEPIEFSRFAGMENDRFILRAITDDIIHDLQDLGAQEYVDVYASSVRLLRPAGLR